MSIIKHKKSSDLYLSDKPPLTSLGKVFLALSYVILIAWAFAIIWPLAQMVLSSFNGNQGKAISMAGTYVFSLDNFRYLFEETYFFSWVKKYHYHCPGFSPGHPLDCLLYWLCLLPLPFLRAQGLPYDHYADPVYSHLCRDYGLLHHA